jgi:ubiquinone/menaquinone biosynthesis C-methylase UbiE
MKDRCAVCSSPHWQLFTTSFDRLFSRPENIWEIRRCQDCGFGWTSPSLPEKELIDHYPPNYLGKTTHTVDAFLSGKLQRSRSWRRETEKIDLLERHITEGHILDVGCGDGKFLWGLDPQKWQRTGVDFAKETLSIVASKIHDINLINGNIFSQKLQKNQFDVITLWHVLEHLPDSLRVLERAHKLLRPGGWIVISVPNFSSLQARLFGRYWYAIDVPRHLYHFSPNSLEILLKKVNLRFQKHQFFSPMANIHSLKYSLIYWSEAYFGNRLPYYLLKPLLFGFPFIERWNKKYGMLTTIARKDS